MPDPHQPKRSKRQITLLLTVSVPHWLSPSQAKREARTRINDLCEWGHRKPGSTEDMETRHFRVKNIRVV